MKSIPPINGKGQLQRLYDVFGTNRVYLRIAKGKKSPIDEGWRTLTLKSSREAGYVLKLERWIASEGNVGIALGAVSEDLCALDFDTEVALAASLELNPRFNSTLCTRANRGAQLWVHIEGERPHQVHKLWVRIPLIAGLLRTWLEAIACWPLRSVTIENHRRALLSKIVTGPLRIA